MPKQEVVVENIIEASSLGINDIIQLKNRLSLFAKIIFGQNVALILLSLGVLIILPLKTTETRFIVIDQIDGVKVTQTVEPWAIPSSLRKDLVTAYIKETVTLFTEVTYKENDADSGKIVLSRVRPEAWEKIKLIRANFDKNNPNVVRQVFVTNSHVIDNNTIRLWFTIHDQNKQLETVEYKKIIDVKFYLNHERSGQMATKRGEKQAQDLNPLGIIIYDFTILEDKEDE